MAACQLHLFAPHRPLLDRFGNDFFRKAPCAPGVYIMTGLAGRVLYIGQSGNLRARLGTYKNARADRAPRKVLRLVNEIRRITWETCHDTTAARLRENELLRTHRPKFNRLNTYPDRYSFLSVRFNSGILSLKHTQSPSGPEPYEAFKSGVLEGFGALLRLIWAALHQPAAHSDFPARLLGRVPRSYSFELFPCLAEPLQREFVSVLRQFLGGTSDRLLPLPEEWQPQWKSPSFESALQTRNLEILRHFYQYGPRRNQSLRARFALETALITKPELDDLAASDAWANFIKFIA
jgi:hypothetical protein